MTRLVVVHQLRVKYPCCTGKSSPFRWPGNGLYSSRWCLPAASVPVRFTVCGRYSKPNCAGDHGYLRKSRLYSKTRPDTAHGLWDLIHASTSLRKCARGTQTSLECLQWPQALIVPPGRHLLWAIGCSTWEAANIPSINSPRWEKLCEQAECHERRIFVLLHAYCLLDACSVLFEAHCVPSGDAIYQAQPLDTRLLQHTAGCQARHCDCTYPLGARTFCDSWILQILQPVN